MELVSLPIILFIACAAALAVGLLAVGAILGPGRNSAVKEMPYESGMDPIHDARRRFDVRFYLVAIAFLIFDVELLFLYPWAVASKNPSGISRAVTEAQRLRIEGFDSNLVFYEVMVFILLLTAGFVYAWRKGVFRWR
jgi:NADH-quinone oxidoreductase subunit A